MDPQPGGSFIPQKPLDSGVRSRGGGFGLFFLVALLFFTASLVAAGGVFGYQQILQRQLADKSKSLQESQDAYQPGVIQDMLRMDARLTQANMLLNKHVAASSLFAFLSTQTLVNVSWSSFGYVVGADGSAVVTLSGQADSFSTVALQSDQLGANKLLKDVIFSGISVGNNGGITFSVGATVDPSLLLYASSLGGSPETTTATTTTI